QCQRYKCRYQHSTCYYYTKFFKKLPGKPFQKNYGNKYNGDSDRRSYNGEINFFTTFPGSFHFIHALLQLLVNIFRHYNTIIHHQPCCQYYGQQGKYVDSKAHNEHDKKGTYKADRYIQQGAYRYQP